jgi:hypothetical protein
LIEAIAKNPKNDSSDLSNLIAILLFSLILPKELMLRV